MLRSSDWPFPLNLLVRVLGFLSSAALATVMIALGAAVLGWATWLESKWGTPAVQFGVYQSTWFAVLIGLLGVNVLAAAVVRFPWRRKQTGFLLVHAGILMLLIGCWMTRDGGVDGQMSLLEGESSSMVLDPGLHFELAVVSDGSSGDVSAGDSAPKVVDIPFRPGPFNWEDYRQLGWFPWALVGRDCASGVIYDRDGVKLEVLDYYSDSRRTPVPELKLRVGRGHKPDKLDADAWESVTLTVRSFGKNQMSPHGSMTVGAWRELGHGEIVLFRLATDEAETESFRDSRPVGPLGRSGQIVLHAGGEKFHFLVDDLKVGQPMPLGQSGLAVALLEFDRDRLQIALEILRPGEKGGGAGDKESKKRDAVRAGILVLHGFQANLDRQDSKNGVYGSYWFDPKGDKDKSASRPMWIAAGRPRLDIIQSHDEKLYYRTWRAPRLGTIGQLPADGSATVVFDRKYFAPAPEADKKELDTGDGVIPANVYVASFTPADRPGVEIRPLPFKKDGAKAPRVKVRLSVDGNSREFWLAVAAAADAEDERRRLVKGDAKAEDASADVERGAAVQLANDTQELGFRVVLDDFERRLDPGTSRPSGYSSRIDFAEKTDAEKSDGEQGAAEIFEEDVVVSLNRPASFTDPVDGRTYRFFQTSFSGPYRPGDREFDQAVGGSRKGDELYRSTLSVASDPGRQLKYAGCLMIVAGIVVMYYMKAYFFRRKRRVILQPDKVENQSQKTIS